MFVYCAKTEGRIKVFGLLSSCLGALAQLCSFTALYFLLYIMLEFSRNFWFFFKFQLNQCIKLSANNKPIQKLAEKTNLTIQKKQEIYHRLYSKEN